MPSEEASPDKPAADPPSSTTTPRTATGGKREAKRSDATGLAASIAKGLFSSPERLEQTEAEEEEGDETTAPPPTLTGNNTTPGPNRGRSGRKPITLSSLLGDEPIDQLHPKPPPSSLAYEADFPALPPLTATTTATADELEDEDDEDTPSTVTYGRTLPAYSLAEGRIRSSAAILTDVCHPHDACRARGAQEWM